MAIVKLDEQNYFTGSYAKVGSIDGGVYVNEIPSDLSNYKTTCWRLDTIEEIVTTDNKEYLIDDETGDIMYGEDGEPLYKTDEEGLPVYVTYKTQRQEWVFDDEKYKSMLNEYILSSKISVEQFREFTGEISSIAISLLKQEKITFIDNYKHEARIYFPYGNVSGVQRFNNDDIMSINLSIQAIQTGKYTSVTWKYSNGQYEEADLEYLMGMLERGGELLSKSFDVERVIVAAINAIEDYDVLVAYDAKAEFDKLFFDDTVSE